MSGILDSKKRILDFVITEEGRNQLANGELRFSYATFSDSNVFYTEKSGSIADDISDRIYFEVSSKPQDAVIIENAPVTPMTVLGSIDSQTPTGVFSFKTSDFNIVGSKIARIPNSTSLDASQIIVGKRYKIISAGNTDFTQLGAESNTVGETFIATSAMTSESSGRVVLNELTTTEFIGNEYEQSSDLVCESLTQNFRNMETIGSKDPFDSTTGFKVEPSSHTFEYDSSLEQPHPDGLRVPGTISIHTKESLFQDSRFSHLPNFLFLPPINKATSGQRNVDILGLYNKFNQTPVSYSELKDRLAQNRNNYADFHFEKTSRENNIMIQPLEFSQDSFKKLAVIDFGQLLNEETMTYTSRVFFVGKIYTDGYKNSTYSNIFTIVLSD